MRPNIPSAAPAAIVFLSFAAVGCAPPQLSELRDTTPKGSAFSQALAGEYRRVANFEYTAMLDLKDSDRFAEKGLIAARGAEPVPETLGTWRIPKPHVRRLRSARNRLVAALANRPDPAQPATAAAAQAGYDCWVEQQEENYQPRDIARCRTQYRDAVTALESRGGYPQSVFFPLDSSRLDAAARQRIRRLARRAVRLDAPRVTVYGHADKSGGKAHNLSLSLRRADAVARALIAAGVPRNRVGVAAAGESRPRIATPDGAKAADNRRVEVVFQALENW